MAHESDLARTSPGSLPAQLPSPSPSDAPLAGILAVDAIPANNASRATSTSAACDADAVTAALSDVQRQLASLHTAVAALSDRLAAVEAATSPPPPPPHTQPTPKAQLKALVKRHTSWAHWRAWLAKTVSRVLGAQAMALARFIWLARVRRILVVILLWGTARTRAWTRVGARAVHRVVDGVARFVDA
ncbi:hypothetical protein AMAG_05868 [Allomyces macrogynus ATCC 38327]|uniref:Uncharacterized protein n=1 Tax=Allomyces macrogynus (strain ATCC 38327) TaxID=578462 RepID=A0A0L0SDM4_ALLM3|nr:hypothetical protein AMAG_05868 [Allomyces macrogynus ATCC 38327]|eukprot:KNE60485.1 hypothetical protein AMAG_05868 [Allomyces macrogynus ATCC 38327]